jgi:hypothetical protein
MDTTQAVQVVEAWLRAANAADIEAVLEHSAPDIEIHGPRGAARGRDVLSAWLARANATFETRCTFARGEHVVVEQHGTWRTPEGRVQGEADVATRFRVIAGLVTELERFDTTAQALARAGLGEEDAR